MKTSGLNDETRRIWDRNAAFWDERMGDGNDFQRLLVAPATERLLQLRPGEAVLEIACGNGVFARRLAELDATQPDQFASLGERRFDAAVCNMAIMDMADIDPLMAGIRQVVKPK